MISTVLSALIGNYMTTFFVIGLIVATVTVLAHRGHRSPSFVSGTYLNSFLLWAVGIAQILNFVMHSVFGDYAAKTIGWAQSPFQLELAISSLAFGVMAIILSKKNSAFRGKVAVVVAQAIFGFGAASGHIYQMIVNHDYAANNTGLLLVMDIAIAAIGLVFVIWHAAARRTQPAATDAVTERQTVSA